MTNVPNKAGRVDMNAKRSGRTSLRAGVFAAVALGLIIPVAASGQGGASEAGDMPTFPALPAVSDGVPASPSSADISESRHEFSGVSDAVARETLVQQFDETISTSLFPDVHLPGSVHLGRYIDAHTAQIENPGSAPNGIVESTLPLRAREDGQQEPLSDDLEVVGTHYEAENALVDAEIPTELAQGILLDAGRVRVTPATVDGSDPRQVDEKLFYPNTDTDTDTLVAPLPTGVEIFYQLRSAKSPEEQVLGFDAPGARLEQAGGGGATLMSGDDAVVDVQAPVASDADGRPVPVHYELDEDRLTVIVDHRDEGYLYPILVDPVVVPSPSDGWAWGWGSTDINYWGWGGTSSGYNGLFPPTQNGLMNRARQGYSYSPGSYSWWFSQAFANTFIERVDYVDLDHTPSAPTACTFMGMLNASANGWVTSTFSGNGGNVVTGYFQWPFCGAIWTHQAESFWVGSSPTPDLGGDAEGPDGDYATFGLTTTGGPGNRTSNAQNITRYAILYRYDAHPPTASVSQPPSSAWRDPGSQSQVNVAVNDAGMGVHTAAVKDGQGSAVIDLDNDPDPYQAEVEQGCSGSHTSRCPTAATLTVPYRPEQGVRSMSAAGFDVSGNVSNNATWTERVDRTPPTIEATSGSLTTMNNQVLDQGSYGLQVTARDGYASPDGSQRSGVGLVEFTVDGSTKATIDPGCAATDCPPSVSTSQPWQFQTSEYAPGWHDIRIVVTDKLGRAGQAGHTTTSSPIHVGVSPDTSISGGPSGLTSANDPTFSFVSTPAGAASSLQCSLDGGAYSTCSNPKTYPDLTDGPHTVSVRAVGVVGADPSPASRSFVVDATAPSLAATGWSADQAPLSGQGAPLVGALPEITASAADAGSGVTSAKFMLDGQELDQLSQDCPAGGCELDGSLLPDLSSLPAGPHTYAVVVADAAGNVREVSGALTLDPTRPVVAIEGALVESAGGPLLAANADAAIHASDGAAGDSGVRRVTLAVDGHDELDDETTCSPSCPGAADDSYTFVKDDWGKGPHGITVTATDAAGNVARESFDADVAEPTSAASCSGVSPTVQDPLEIASVGVAVDSAPEAAVASSEEAYDETSGSTLAPTLDRPDDSPPTPIETVGSLTTDELASIPAGGWTIDGVVDVVPMQTTGSESNATIVNSDAAVYANSAAKTDTIVRPAASGVTIVESKRGPDAPTTLSWTACPQAGYELEELDSGAIAIVDPARAADPALQVPDPPADAESTTALPDAETQLAVAEYETAAAEEETGQSVVAVITLAFTVDWSGDPTAPEPLTLGQDGLVTMSTSASTQWAVLNAYTNPAKPNAPGAVPAHFMNLIGSPEVLRSRAEDVACKFARSQPSDGKTRAMVFEFGKPETRGGEFGAHYQDSDFFSNSQIANALRHASDSYADNGGCWAPSKPVGSAYLTYATTNNMAESLGAADLRKLGRRHASTAVDLYWQYIRQHMDHHYNQSTAVASDIEPVWSHPGPTKDYISELKQSFGGLFFNVGNAAGCPPDFEGCIKGWNGGDLAQVSFGAGGTPIPEVYNSTQAKQWKQIRNIWNTFYQPVDKPKVSFYGASGYYKKGGEVTLTPPESWAHLRDETNGAVGRELINFKFSQGG